MPVKRSTTESYAELKQQLEVLIAKLQDPTVSIDDATHHYEQALKLIAKMEHKLEHAENRVREIRAQFGEVA